MGAPTPSLAAVGLAFSGGSLTRYLGNLYRTLGPAVEAFKSAAELRRTFTGNCGGPQNIIREWSRFRGVVSHQGLSVSGPVPLPLR